MAPAKPIVADASVIAKWFIEENEREGALRLRAELVAGKVAVACPALMPFEVMNAIRFSKKALEEDKLKALGRSLSLYGIKLHQLRGWYLQLSVESSLRNAITFYDGSYVGLARRLDTFLFTADKALLSSLIDDAKCARHIDEYPLA